MHFSEKYFPKEFIKHSLNKAHQHQMKNTLSVQITEA